MARNTSAAIQQYRGTTEQHANYTGPIGEITVDTTKNTAVVQDGVTAGGHPLAKEAVTLRSWDVNVFEINGGVSETLAANEIQFTLNNSRLAAAIAGDLVASNDPVLYVNEDSKIASTVSATYDVLTGDFKLLGNEEAVLSELTIPAAVSAVKAVNLLNGKPDESGEAIEGDYHVSMQFADGEGQWGTTVGVNFTTTKEVASAAVAISAALATAGTSTVRAWFNGQEATAEVSGTTATITFADGSVLAFTNISATGTAVGADVTFTPAVGLIAGSYLCVTWALYDGTVSDTYIDMSDLVDVYTAGTGLTLTDNEFAVDESWLTTQITTQAPVPTGGDGITVTSEESVVTIAVDTDWLNTYLASAVTVVSADEGNLIQAGTDGGALLTKAAIADTVVEIIEDTLTSAEDSVACAMISETGGNQLACDNGKLLVVSDYGTMDD